MSLPEQPATQTAQEPGQAGSKPIRAPRTVHPMLFAAFPVLSLLAHNRHEVHLAWGAVPLACAMAGALAVWAVFGWIFRSRAKGALIASLVVLFFFSFGHTVVPLSDRDSAHWQVLVMQVLLGEVVAVAVVYLLLRRSRGVGALTRFANVVSVVLVVVPLVNLVLFEVRRPRVPAATRESGTRDTSAERPDIYLIIPDAHARADVMRDVYGYDMGPFIAELESLGFAIADRSASNYTLTPFSVASMLNFRYLEEIGKGDWGDLGVPTRLIRESALEATLKSRGYKTIAFPTGAPYTEMRHFDQYYHGLGAAAGFYRLIVELTPLSVLLENNDRWNNFISDRSRLLFTLDQLPAIAMDPSPTFAFVHLEMPHPPFRFGEDGQDVFAEYRDLDDDGVGSRSPALQALYPEAYRRQAIYTDRRLLEVVKRILATSRTPPVIAIVSDHGPRLNYHWRDPSSTDAREATGNFTAVYLPGGARRDVVYEDITPVNVIRGVLNSCLGTDLPALQDESFLSTDSDGRHLLTNVTGAARSTGEDRRGDSGAHIEPRSAG